ncbi:hypothetical protein [Niveispirillum sp. BGYR6]|uniref:hypothetical protein n=1 Tax=Niveispirillum sp. BGYR6 TaxID=2971249 RepID=UPI0022B966C0|nr:hypothetical protein [Niveispirillum sp. BGYR6]MDG5494189.1 hypothetical protein [Niveispirillum sp. BGYR6]
MATLITINVTNNSPTQQNMFFFQQPSIYVGGSKVYSNSIFTSPLSPSASSGAVLTFQILLQHYAAVQQQVSPPIVGQPSGYSSAIQAIDLAPADGGAPTLDTTYMTVNPLGLSPPVNSSGPQPGTFRIVTPSYDPILAKYNAGSGVRTSTGGVILSNFVTAEPGKNLDCQPILKFYVQTGTYTPGSVMNFTQSSINAALCDATSGFTTFNVTYNPNGTWSVVPYALARAANGERVLISAVEANNATILNEAGTGSVSLGYCANFNAPEVTVQNLTNPAAVIVNHEYQVGPNGGPFVGRICVAKNGNTAIFA